jgi:hypothetical protein
MFPFPLGKTSAKATIKDELWWEGGNAPHVVSLPLFPLVYQITDHTRDISINLKNQLRLAPRMGRSLRNGSKGPRRDWRLMIRGLCTLYALVFADDRWKRRIRSIQLLSIVAITSFSKCPLHWIVKRHSRANIFVSDHTPKAELTSSISKSSNRPPNLPNLQYPLNRNRNNAPTPKITR